MSGNLFHQSVSPNNTTLPQTTVSSMFRLAIESRGGYNQFITPPPKTDKKKITNQKKDPLFNPLAKKQFITKLKELWKNTDTDKKQNKQTTQISNKIQYKWIPDVGRLCSCELKELKTNSNSQSTFFEEQKTQLPPCDYCVCKPNTLWNCEDYTQIIDYEPKPIGNIFELTYDKIKTIYCMNNNNNNNIDGSLSIPITIQQINFPCQLGIKVNGIFIIIFFIFHTTEQNMKKFCQPADPVDFRLSAGEEMCWKFDCLKGLTLRASQSVKEESIKDNNRDNYFAIGGGYYFDGQTKNKLDACIVFWRDTTFQFYYDPAQINHAQIKSIELVCGDGSNMPIFPEPTKIEVDRYMTKRYLTSIINWNTWSNNSIVLNKAIELKNLIENISNNNINNTNISFNGNSTSNNNSNNNGYGPDRGTPPYAQRPLYEPDPYPIQIPSSTNNNNYSNHSMSQSFNFGNNNIGGNVNISNVNFNIQQSNL